MTNTTETTSTATAATLAETGATDAPKPATRIRKATATNGAPKGQKRVTTEAAAATAKATKTAKGARKAAKVAPAETKASKTTTTAKKATKATSPREGSKKAVVLELLRQKGGATMTELTKKTGWQARYADVQIMPTCVGNPACGAVIAAMESA